MAERLQHEEVVELLTQYQRRLRVFLRTLIGDRSDVEDLLQEVNLFVWSHAGEYQPGTDFGAWVFRVAHFHVLTWRKRQARQKLRFSDELVEQLVEPATAQAERTDLREVALESCLNKLAPEERELVRQRYEVGGTAAEVASRLGRTAKAVYHSLNRIHLRLLRCVERWLRYQQESP